MESPEVPTEHLHEEINHHARRGDRWSMGVALSSALLAGLAAVASLRAGHEANEAMLSQIQCANKWSYFQSKSIKAAQLNSKMEILTALGNPVEQRDKEKSVEYALDQEKIKREAEDLQIGAQVLLQKHEVLARGVTMFQIAIAIGAISVLTQRRPFWFVSMAFGGIGILFLCEGLLSKVMH